MVIAKFRSQLSISWVQASAQNAANWLQRAHRDFANDCRWFAADSRRVLVLAHESLARVGSQIFAASAPATAELHPAPCAVVASTGSIAFQTQGIAQSRATSERDLHNLVAGSPDPVVVTDGNRRLVAANASALELFGISELNMRNFTLDAFVSSAGPAALDWGHTRSKDREAKLSRCKIRRLDGGVLLAECEFVAGIAPRRYLCRFLNVAPYRIAPPNCAKRDTSHRPGFSN